MLNISFESAIGERYKPAGTFGNSKPYRTRTVMKRLYPDRYMGIALLALLAFAFVPAQAGGNWDSDDSSDGKG